MSDKISSSLSQIQNYPAVFQSRVLPSAKKRKVFRNIGGVVIMFTQANSTHHLPPKDFRQGGQVGELISPAIDLPVSQFAVSAS